MLKQETLDKMHAMKLHATAEAFEQQLGSSQWAELSFEDRVGLLVDAEWTYREQRKLAGGNAEEAHAAAFRAVSMDASSTLASASRSAAASAPGRMASVDR